MSKIGLIPKVRLMRQIGSAYESAARSIVAILRGLNPATYTAGAGSAAMARIREIVERLDVRATDWARKSIRAAYQESRDVAVTRLQAIGAERPKTKKGSGKRIHEKAITKYIKFTAKDYLRANRTILTTAGKYLATLAYARKRLDSYRDAEIEAFSSADVRGLIDDVVQRATASHLTRKAVDSKIYERLLSAIGGGDYITINGRSYNLRSYAELVARTRMRGSQTEAVLKMCEEYGTDLVEIPHHDNPCEFCAEHQGHVFSISGNSDKYPELPDGGPPFHPNCECTTNPTTELALRWRNR